MMFADCLNKMLSNLSYFVSLLLMKIEGTKHTHTENLNYVPMVIKAVLLE